MKMKMKMNLQFFGGRGTASGGSAGGSASGAGGGGGAANIISSSTSPNSFNDRSDILNRTEYALTTSDKAAGKEALDRVLTDLNKGDSITVDAKTYKGSTYKTEIVKESSNSYKMSEVVKGKTFKPTTLSKSEAISELMYFKTRAGGKRPNVTINLKG